MGNVEAQLHHRALKALPDPRGLCWRSLDISWSLAQQQLLTHSTHQWNLKISPSVALRKFPNLFLCSLSVSCAYGTPSLSPGSILTVPTPPGHCRSQTLNKIFPSQTPIKPVLQNDCSFHLYTLEKRFFFFFNLKKAPHFRF